MDFKRDEIKYIRDRAKGRYKKDSSCRICGSSEKLDFHHFYTLTPLYNKWKRDEKVKVTNEEELLAIRDRFITEHMPEMYDHTVTLCHMHHMKLHSIYGKDPALVTAPKQMNWVEIQRGKNGLN